MLRARRLDGFNNQKDGLRLTSATDRRRRTLVNTPHSWPQVDESVKRGHDEDLGVAVRRIKIDVYDCARGRLRQSPALRRVPVHLDAVTDRQRRV